MNMISGQSSVAVTVTVFSETQTEREPLNNDYAQIITETVPTVRGRGGEVEEERVLSSASVRYSAELRHH